MKQNNIERRANCSMCSCLNRDYENGYDCNLGFDVSLKFNQKGDHFYCSDNCELVSIKCENREWLKADNMIEVIIDED